MEPPMQERSRKDKLRDHLLKAQEEYRVAKEAVFRAQREINAMPAVDGHSALRKALQKETRSLQRVAQMLKQFSDFPLEKTTNSKSQKPCRRPPVPLSWAEAYPETVQTTAGHRRADVRPKGDDNVAT